MPKKLWGRLAAIVLPSILGLAGCRSAFNYFEKGNSAFAEGKFAEATLDYRAAIQKDPSFGEAYYRAALSELKQNKAAQALEDLQTAVRLLPASDTAKTDLTNLLLGAYVGDSKRPKFLYDLLVKYSNEWLKRDPDSMQGLRIKGYLAMLEQRPEEAAELLRHAHASHPHDEKIVDGLLDALFRSNQPGEAEKVGLDFVRTDPGASDVYDALFRIYTVANRTQDAENILKQKVAANPKERGYLLDLASFYAGVHRTQDVDQTMHTFLSGHESDAATRVQAGDFYSSMGALDQALQQYRAGADLGKKGKLICDNRIARVLLLQNKRQEGLEVLNKTLAQFPDDEEARALRAALLVQTPGSGKRTQGVDELRALLQKKPNDMFLKFLLARALAETQNFSEARTRLEEVVKLQPDFLDAHLLLADIAYKQHDAVETLKQSESALDIDPQNLRARMLRGSALLAEGNLDQAGAVFGSLAEQVPQSLDIKLKLAEVSLKRRDYADAEAALNKILQDHPTEARAVAGLVDVDLAQNRPEKALDRLDAELTRSKGSPAIRQLTAATALRLGKYNLAIENLRQLASQTNSITPLIDMAQVFQLKGDVHNAILSLQKASALQPKDPRPGALLPFLLESESRDQEAKQVARRALAARPKDTVAMNNLAYLMAETGDSLDEALKLAHAAVRQQPNNPVFLDTLGFIYLKRDQNDDALDIFQRLIRRFPDDPACVYHTAIAWYQKGDRQRARTMLSRALELRPPKEIEAGVNDLLTRIN
jgi:tetratricopeptide (TPR) repeat protein